jgi:hypothetical protein
VLGGIEPVAALQYHTPHPPDEESVFRSMLEREESPDISKHETKPMELNLIE